jgi:hypothetical protein
MTLHIAPPSSRLKKQSPRRKENQPEGDCAIYVKRRVIWLRVANKTAAQTRGGLTAPQGRLNRVWCTNAAMRRKFTLQARSLYASQDKTSKWIPSPEVPKAAFATHVVRRVTWAIIARMVTLLNPTLSIMIFISLGMTRWTFVL